MFDRVVHADWSTDRRKKWMCSAETAPEGWWVTSPRRVPAAPEFIGNWLFGGGDCAGWVRHPHWRSRCLRQENWLRQLPGGARRMWQRRMARVLCSSGLKPRMPSRASADIRAVMIRVRSPTRLSRSRPERLASSSSSDGIATNLQCRGSPRSQPRNTRISISVSRRSVLARRCSCETATLEEWIT